MAKKTNKRTLDVPKEITDALSVPPIEYLRKWWMNNSTDEERTAAEDRDATLEGAYAFIEDFSKRAKHKTTGACLPDKIVYDLTGIFMRLCVDGDVYATADEIKKDEESAKRIADDEQKRKDACANRKAEAEQRETDRLASLSPEEREIYEKEKAEREAKSEQSKEEQEALRVAREAEEKIRREKKEAVARKKALAAEMEKRQMTLF